MRLIICLLGLGVLLAYTPGCIVPVDHGHDHDWHDDHHDDFHDDHH